MIKTVFNLGLVLFLSTSSLLAVNYYFVPTGTGTQRIETVANWRIGSATGDVSEAVPGINMDYADSLYFSTAISATINFYLNTSSSVLSGGKYLNKFNVIDVDSNSLANAINFLADKDDTLLDATTFNFTAGKNFTLRPTTNRLLDVKLATLNLKGTAASTTVTFGASSYRLRDLDITTLNAGGTNTFTAYATGDFNIGAINYETSNAMNLNSYRVKGEFEDEADAFGMTIGALEFKDFTLTASPTLTLYSANLIMKMASITSKSETSGRAITVRVDSASKGLIITGDVKVTGASSFTLDNATSAEEIRIKGNVELSGNATRFNCYTSVGKVIVEKDFKVSTSSSLYGGSSLEVKGVLNHTSPEDTDTALTIGAATGAVSHIKVGGISGGGKSQSTRITTVSTGKTATVEITGVTNDQIYAGRIHDFGAASTPDYSETATGKLGFTMNAASASFKQYLAGQTYYRGDTVVKQGSLFIQASGAGTSGTKYGIANLILQGGGFGPVGLSKTLAEAQGENKVGTVIVNGDFTWSGGKLLIAVDGATNSLVDVKGNFAKGEGVLVGTKFDIEFFGANVDLDKDYEIISWEGTSIVDFSESDFRGIFDTSLTNLEAVFTKRLDGLYVNFNAIPEPAEYAAMFGLAAILFALYRRRK